ncbi:type ISP restriction/modification enzyme [Mycolicibacterium fortuitum]|uniref:type ISP restriction/modification enzyme n=1 Tax=Mycolicibacterium fortuitum TaxID=1766 RepID=UPI0010427BE8|nr:type ISP restriction/modification enzyme [Mycolicibacterium fortuitum]
MAATKPVVSDYLEEVRAQYATGQATEHAYRPALQRLMRSFPDVEAVNDPKQSEHGAPDFVFQRKSNNDVTLGYAEAKDIGIKLDKVEQSDQMHRYSGYQNLFLTDYLDFRFFRDGIKYQTVTVATITDGKLVFHTDEYARLENELAAFLALPPQQLTSGKRLAEIMGAKTRRIRDDLTHYFSDNPAENSDLVKIFNLMRTMLVRDLDHERFADMYAQTLVYGLFVARFNDPTPDTFTRAEARLLIPKTNPFLRQFFDHIVGTSFDDRLAQAVDELCQVFAVSDVRDLVTKHLNSSGGDSVKDPIIHFYEDYLQAYDPHVRRRLGAYYTPLPVVRFMVRQVDKHLKEAFGISKGLADSSKIARNHRTYLTDLKTGAKSTRYKDQKVEYHKVQILDPATGTATFLNEIVNFLYAGFAGQEGLWPKYATDVLLPRLSGFELMMAPYTIAHLKLGMTLAGQGVELSNRRLGVYLTNTLEEGIPHQPDLFSIGLAEAVTEESQEAGRIKSERPVMVVIGNPPYSGVSSNETTFANQLVQRYKVEPGGTTPLKERKHWLNDDYVKFISFAEQMVTSNGEGIVALITNHGYLDNITFRGMRWRLARSFDEIYILDLHGSTLKGETSLPEVKDQNVFDILPGVSIIFGIKKPGATPDKLATVRYAELWGPRMDKFKALDGDEITWTELTLDKKMCYFSPKETAGQEQYDAGISLDDLFLTKVTGVLTMGDGFVVADKPETLQSRIQLLASKPDPVQLKKQFKLGKNYGPWILESADNLSFKSEHVTKYAYRPFDYRYLYYDTRFVWRHRDEVMKHMIGHPDNFGVVICRQIVSDFSHVFCFEGAVDDSFLSNKSRERGYAVPMYLYQQDGTRTSNLAPTPLKKLKSKLVETYEDVEIMDYIYGILHSAAYTEEFQAFLARDFPKVPIPPSDEVFRHVSACGYKLRRIHLLKSDVLNDLVTTYPVSGSDTVDRYTFDDGRVWINAEQYFGGVSETVWNAEVGAYRPAQKWLKDRRGGTLTYDDIVHYQKVLTALERSMEVMAEIDLVN